MSRFNRAAYTQPCPRAAVQPCSRAAEQPSSHAAVRPCARAAVQPCSHAAVLPSAVCVCCVKPCSVVVCLVLVRVRSYSRAIMQLLEYSCACDVVTQGHVHPRTHTHAVTVFFNTFPCMMRCPLNNLNALK